MTTLDTAQPPDEGTLLAPEQTVGAAPAQLQTPVRSFTDLRDAKMSMDTRKEFDSASQKGDWDTANQAYARMRHQAGQASTEILVDGGDPSVETRPIAKFVHPSIEGERRGMFLAQKEAKVNGFVQQHEWFNQRLIPYMQDVLTRYKEKNEAQLGPWTPDTMTDQQKEDYMLKLQPIREDPNVVAEMRQSLVEMDREGKQVDPNFSVFHHPSTRKWAHWLNREGGDTGFGYLRSREQELELGALGRTALVGAEAVEAVADPILNATFQLMEWEGMAMRAIGLDSLALNVPQNYIEGPDGEIMVNQARPHPGLIDIVQGTLAAVQGRDVSKEMAKLGRIREMEKAQRHGLTNLVHGVANTAGAFAGFSAAGGAAMRAGGQSFALMGKKGLNYVAGLGVKGAESAKALKFVELWGSRVGGALGQGAFEATAYGKMQGYTNQFLHGMAMFPALATMGYYGQRLEKALQKHAKMPRKVAGMLSEGMTMGAPFATLEMAEMGLWEHLKNPNESTLDVYLRNILGAMLFRGIRPEHRPSIQQEAYARMTLQAERSGLRAQAAHDVFAGRRKPEEILKEFPTLDKNDLMRLGEAEMRKRSETNLERRMDLAEQQRKLEQQLDIKEYGLEGKVEKELGMIVEEHRPDREVPRPPEGPTPPSGTQQFVGPTRRQTYRVEGAEPKRLERSPKSAVKEAKKAAAYRQKRMEQQRDPLEEADYGDRPLAERRLIQKARNEQERREIAFRLEEGAERYQVEPDKAEGMWRVKDTRTGESTMTGFTNRLQAEKWAERRAVQEARPEAAPHPERPLSSKVRDYPKEKDMEPILGKDGLWRVKDKRSGEALMTGIDSKGEAQSWIRQKAFQETQRLRRGTLREAERPIPGMLQRPPAPKGTKPPPKVAKEPQKVAKAEGEVLGSLKAGADFPIDPVASARKVTLDDIFAEMTGRLPRKGMRVPFTAVRLGAKAGDPVRPAFRKGSIAGGKGVRGLFKIFENLVRTRGGRDLVASAHEWSHAMQKQMLSGDQGGTAFNLAAKRWVESLPKEVLAEFPAILEGYANWQKLSGRAKGMEVWAEWHARDLLGDPTLQQQAPRLTDYFRRQLVEPRNALIREQYARIRDRMLDYRNIGAAGRLEASIQWAGEVASESVRATQPTRLEKARDKIIQNFFDDNIVLKRGVEKWLEAAGKDPATLNVMDDPGRQWDILRMTAHKKAEQFVMHGITREGKHTPGIKEIFQGLKGREKNFSKYMVALVNAQRIKRGKEATLSMEDYVSEIRRLQTENPDFRTKARELKAWTDTLVDWVAETGNLAPAQAQRIKDAYVAWVPFFRIMDGPQGPGMGARAGLGVPREAVKKVKGGGTERIQDPMMAMFDAATQMISNAHRTMIVGSLYKMAVGREAGGLATVIPKKRVPKDHPLIEVLNAIEKKVEIPAESQLHFEDMISALKKADALDAQTVTLFSQKIIPTGERNVMAFTPRLDKAEIDRVSGGDRNIRKMLEKNNNKTQWLEMDPNIYETLMGLDVPPMHRFFESGFLGSAFRVATRATRLFATGLAPGFIVANKIRDNVSKPLFSQDGKFRPFGGFADDVQGAAIYHAKNGPGSYRELYQEMAVPVSSFFHAGTRKKIIGEARTFMDKTRAFVERVEEIFAAPENYLRIQEFTKIHKRAKAEGKTELEARLLAAEAGREITVNFARAGIISRFMNGMVPYFSASLAGQRKLWRQIGWGGDGKTDIDRARIQRAALANGIANITVPTMILWWMNKDEDWYQDLPEWQKLSYWNFKFGDTVVKFPKPFEAGAVFGGIPETMMERWVAENGTPPSLGTVLQDGLFPYLKYPGDALPALIKPIIEMQANYDFFRDRPLTPKWIASTRVPEDQVTFYTTEVSRILSQALNGAVTPIEVEKIIGGYTANSGTYALRLVDEMLGLKNHPGLSINPIQRFFTEPHRTGYFQNEFYDISRELDQKAGSKVATGSELALRKQVNRVKQRLSDITKAVRAGTMTSVEAGRLRYEMTRPLVERYEELE